MKGIFLKLSFKDLRVVKAFKSPRNLDWTLIYCFYEAIWFKNFKNVLRDSFRKIRFKNFNWNLLRFRNRKICFKNIYFNSLRFTHGKIRFKQFNVAFLINLTFTELLKINKQLGEFFVLKFKNRKNLINLGNFIIKCFYLF